MEHYNSNHVKSNRNLHPETLHIKVDKCSKRRKNLRNRALKFLYIFTYHYHKHRTLILLFIKVRVAHRQLYIDCFTMYLIHSMYQYLVQDVTKDYRCCSQPQEMVHGYVFRVRYKKSLCTHCTVQKRNFHFILNK